MNFLTPPDPNAHEEIPEDGGDCDARAHQKPFIKKIFGDARDVPLQAGAADLVVTSPPYWLKRDYGFEGQIGQEPTPDGYVSSMLKCMENWRKILPVWGSVFVNIGDTYHKGVDFR